MYVLHVKAQIVESETMSATDIRCQVRHIKSQLTTRMNRATEIAQEEKDLRAVDLETRLAFARENPAAAMAEMKAVLHKCGTLKQSGTRCGRRVRAAGMKCTACKSASNVAVLPTQASSSASSSAAPQVPLEADAQGEPCNQLLRGGRLCARPRGHTGKDIGPRAQA